MPWLSCRRTHLLTFLENPFKKDAPWVPQIAVKQVLVSEAA
jgi:hypothetical protein